MFGPLSTNTRSNEVIKFGESLRLLAESSRRHEALRGVRRLAWAVEEVTDRSADGVEFLVPLGDDHWWVSIGWGQVVAEVVFQFDPSLADGVAVISRPTTGESPQVLSVGPWSSEAESPLASRSDSVSTSSLLPAISIPRLGDLLESAFRASRPEVTFVWDQTWDHHRHPLGHLLQRS